MTNKQLWRTKGDVDYIRIEARPPRQNKLGVTVELDWLPAEDSGAYDAYTALMKAGMSKKTPEDAKAFYAELLKFARQNEVDEEVKKEPW